jgi:hypothetical protein
MTAGRIEVRTIDRALRISSFTVIRSGRYSRVRHIRAISRNRRSRISASIAGGRWWRRSAIRREISVSRSTMLRRRTSVGWAVSTGTTFMAARTLVSSAGDLPSATSALTASTRVRGRSSPGAASASAWRRRPATSSPILASIEWLARARARKMAWSLERSANSRSRRTASPSAVSCEAALRAVATSLAASSPSR